MFEFLVRIKKMAGDALKQESKEEEAMKAKSKLSDLLYSTDVWKPFEQEKDQTPFTLDSLLDFRIS